MSKFDFSGAGEMKMRSFSFRTVLKSIIISYLFTFLVFAVVSAVITYTAFPEKHIDTVVLITTILSIVISGMIVSAGARANGWLNGGIGGCFYMLVLWALGMVFSNGTPMSKSKIFMLMLGFILGAVGGIIGINMKRK